MKLIKTRLIRARNKYLGPLGIRSISALLNPVDQMALKLAYRQLRDSGGEGLPLEEVGFKVYSADDIDGMLLYIFSIIGTTNKRSVEMCAGDGIECNTSNLIVNHGWHGLLFDGNADLVANGKEFYRLNKSTKHWPPQFVHAWITRDNVNELIAGQGFAGDIDLLSIDMDGVDYWIWEAMSSLNPRVVVAEYQDIIAHDRALTVPYADTFTASDYPMTRGLPNFCGASLLALSRLGSSKGYRLVGVSRSGIDAIFVRNDLGAEFFPEVTVSACLDHPKSAWGRESRFPTVADLPWVEV